MFGRDSDEEADDGDDDMQVDAFERAMNLVGVSAKEGDDREVLEMISESVETTSEDEPQQICDCGTLANLRHDLDQILNIIGDIGGNLENSGCASMPSTTSKVAEGPENRSGTGAERSIAEAAARNRGLSDDDPE